MLWLGIYMLSGVQLYINTYCRYHSCCQYHVGLQIRFFNYVRLHIRHDKQALVSP